MSVVNKNNEQAASVSLSRRSFIAGLSAGSLVLMGKMSFAQETLQKAQGAEVETFAPDFFVSIAPDGQIAILAHRSEMGTGIRTGLPRIVADELEADWDKVTIVQAPGDKRLGDQNTDGSNSIRFFFKRMRTAGATARTMLERAAAKKWGVDASECYAENHQIKHRNSNKSLGFGELVELANDQTVPKASELKLKKKADWKYIGKDVAITDMDDILTGKAVFGIDARMENQLFAVVARPPVVRGKVKSVDKSAALKVPGVKHIIELKGFENAPMFNPLGGVAVVADSTWAAISGREALEIEWDDGPNADYDTEKFAAQLKAEVNKPGTAIREVGDVEAASSKASKKVSADYSVPHLAHAPMEPTCAVADVKTDSDGKVTSCHVLCATQNPQAVQQAVGPAMGMQPDDVLVNVTLLGAGFGRKSKPDYCVEAAELSRELKRPIHVTWTREDDLQHDYYHAISAIHCEASLDEQGNATSWLQRIAFPTISSTFTGASATRPAAWEAEMGHSDLPFAVPNIKLESGEAKSHVRIGWLRSVCHIQQNFAVSSFADELAHAAGIDPYEYLLQLLGEDRQLDMKAARLSNRGASPEEYPYDIGRLKAVLSRAAARSDWKNRIGSLEKGSGLGIACARSFLGYTGHVVEVKVSKDGSVSIPKVWVSLDSGTIVSPDRVVSQVEGAAIMGASQALYGQMTFKDGRAEQTNFDGFQVAKMHDSPMEIDVDVVDSEAAPAGVGETGVPSFAPALCNAIFNATGKRIRDLPIANHDLSWS